MCMEGSRRECENFVCVWREAGGSVRTSCVCMEGSRRECENFVCVWREAGGSVRTSCVYGGKQEGV